MKIRLIANNRFTPERETETRFEMGWEYMRNPEGLFITVQDSEHF